ncbi:MAG: hypothetical protein P8106_05510, partial [Gammaproteobacteria bacterium]
PDPAENLVCLQAGGMVVHQNAMGFGLLFDELEPACQKALRQLLTDGEVPPDEGFRLPAARPIAGAGR